MSQESTPTLSVIAPFRAKLLEKMQLTPSDPGMVKEIKSEVHQDLQKRYLLFYINMTLLGLFYLQFVYFLQ